MGKVKAIKVNAIPMNNLTDLSAHMKSCSHRKMILTRNLTLHKKNKCLQKMRVEKSSATRTNF